MANYATNIFHASTENKQDLDKIEAFLDDNFNGFVNRYGDTVDAEFSSRWEYPEKEIDELVASLEAKDKIYIRILTYELEDEYVSFRIFSQGKWDIKRYPKNAFTMYEYEEDSDIIGLSCTLLNPYKGYTEGTIVGNYGNTIVVRLESGKEISEYRDEVIIHD